MSRCPSHGYEMTTGGCPACTSLFHSQPFGAPVYAQPASILHSMPDLTAAVLRLVDEVAALRALLEPSKEP